MDKLPPWWKPQAPRKISDKHERRLSIELGARQHSNSGAGIMKYDMSTDNFLIEAKRTIHKSFSINVLYWIQLAKIALSKGKEPAMVIQIQGTEVVVIRKELFQDLIKG